MKPRLFVGSSVEGLDVARAIQDELRHDADVTVWNQGIFGLSSTTIDDLLESLSRTDFGIFVFSADDIVQIRKQEFSTARDNVVLELGLFLGRLGRKRTFFFIPSNAIDFHLPSDLTGVSPGIYESHRVTEEAQAAVASACNQVRIAIRRLGPIGTSPDQQLSELITSVNESTVTAERQTGIGARSVKAGRQEPYDESTASKIAYITLSGKILSAISFTNAGSDRPYIAVLHAHVEDKGSYQATKYHVSLLEQVGSTFRVLWEDEDVYYPRDLEVIDIDKDGVKEISYIDESFGNAAGSNFCEFIPWREDSSAQSKNPTTG